MPNFTGFLERDPVKRPHIYEWSSQFAYNTTIDSEAGVGYFIKRRNGTVNFTLPQHPYDGDVVSIIDITKGVELDAAWDKFIHIIHPLTNVWYNNKAYDELEEFDLAFITEYQTLFMYVESINTWISSFIKIDGTIIDPTIKYTGLIYYGECMDNGTTIDKVASVIDTYEQGLGSHIRIIFHEDNRAENPTLDVNEWGKAPIHITTNTPAGPGAWSAGQAVDLVFDGAKWLIVGSTTTKSSGGGTFVGLNENQIREVISGYLIEQGITGVSNSKIRTFIREYLEENGASAGITPEECTAIIQNFLSINGYTPGGGSGSGGGLSVTQVNNLIEQYINSHNIGSGGSVNESQVNNLIEQYINNNNIGKNKGITYCTSPTAENIVTKIATIADGSTFELKVGSSVRVKFTAAQTASTPTLNVANTGAKPIKSFGETAAKSGQWKAGEVIDFVYDGTNWVIVDGSRKDDMDNLAASIASSPDVTNLVNSAVQQALQGDIGAIIDQKTSQTISALTAMVDGKIADLDADVAQTITDLRAEIATTTTNLEGNISTALADLTAQITAAKQSIADGINEQISTAFDASIDQKIQENFNGVVQGMIDTATANLTSQIEAARTELSTAITDSTTALTNRITNDTEALNTRITNAIDDLEHNLETEIANIRADVTNIVNNVFSTTIDEKIDTAFNETIDNKIRAAFTDAEGTLNAAIAGYNQTINVRMTEIQDGLNLRVDGIEQNVSTTLATFESNINTIINETFDTAIETKIDEAFQSRLEQQINAQFSAVIEQQINAAIEDLRTELAADIKAAKDSLDDQIKTFTDTIDDRIAAHYNAHIANDLNTLKTELQNEIKTKTDELDASIDTKINTKFDSTIDTLMENKFSAMIDTKIEQNFNAIITDRMNAVKQEINDGLDARIDARIRIAIDGEITTLINTKLEEYVAPAIGASY